MGLVFPIVNCLMRFCTSDQGYMRVPVPVERSLNKYVSPTTDGCNRSVRDVIRVLRQISSQRKSGD